MTGWVGKAHEAPLPTALYGAVLAAAGTAYYILVKCYCAPRAPVSACQGLGSDFKARSQSDLPDRDTARHISTWIAQASTCS